MRVRKLCCPRWNMLQIENSFPMYSKNPTWRGTGHSTLPVTNSQSNAETHLSCPTPQLFFNLADDYILTSFFTPTMTHQCRPQCLS